MTMRKQLTADETGTTEGQPAGAERRRSERRTAAPPRGGEARLRRIVEHLADGVVIVDAAGAIRFANPAAEALFARPASQLLGAPFGFPLVRGEPAEVEIVRRGDRPLTVELRAGDVEWEDASALLVSLRDVSDRKQAEERERQLLREQAARAEAEASSQAKSEFLAVMSHELRTPLNAVLGYSELLELGLAGPLTDAQREQLSRIRTSGRHLLSLVNEILDLAKVEAGKLALRRAPGSAADAIATAVTLVQPDAEARGLQLTAGHAGDVPATYLGDEERVAQILVNLLANAIKFTESGGRITVVAGTVAHAEPDARLHGEGPWAFFRVSDTGMGIPEEKLESIFMPFVQADRGHTRKRDGSGLGLTISRRLARLMEGDITVRSALGHGSIFTLWLPVAHEESPAAERAAAAARGDTQEVEGFAQFGECMLRDVEPLLDAIVARLRSDGAIPNARALRFSQLADHLGTLLASVAETLVALEETAGGPSPLLSDGTEIQRVIAERHGAARARFGWSAAALDREFDIIIEETERSLSHGYRRDDADQLERATQVIGRLFEQARRYSLASLERGAPGAS
jgi:signal transduction histidine kinase